MVLNITPDHLDRHGGMEAYTAAKARIFENQTAADFAVLNLDDPASAGLHAHEGPRLLVHSKRTTERKSRRRVRGGEENMLAMAAREQKIMPVSEITLKGAHNLENVLAAVASDILSGCDAGAFAKPCVSSRRWSIACSMSEP